MNWWKIAKNYAWKQQFDPYVSNMPFNPLFAAYNSKDRIYIPFQSTRTQAKAPEYIAKVLSSIGYTVLDYSKGICVSNKDKRQFKIGRILQFYLDRTGKGDFKKALYEFEKDPQRGAVNSGQMSIVISQNPHDIATCSHNRGWTSCYDLEVDPDVSDLQTENADHPLMQSYEPIDNSHVLEEEIQRGTIIAYLIRSNDKEIENPLARVLIDRDKNGQLYINKQNDRTQGTLALGFIEAVEKWIQEANNMLQKPEMQNQNMQWKPLNKPIDKTVKTPPYQLSSQD
jgi:hypothetical protein